MEDGARVLVVGGGGREHALAWKLAQSPRVGAVLVAPGNGGTAGDAGGKVHNAALDVSKNDVVVSFCRAEGIELVCVGPEIPLVNGLGDALREAGILCFGPSGAAARLEGSKAFSKDFMVRNGVPTAEHKAFSDFHAAKAYVLGLPDSHKVVVKASGLAAGKGVILPETHQEAIAALEQIMVAKEFGEEAGAEVVVEELLEGPEASVFAFSDGKGVHLLPAAQDHKRIFDGDLGPNTGGMGAYCPAPVLTPELEALVRETVVQRSVDAAAAEGFPFVGLLYCGLMLTPQGPKLLEYNCRFGDPETQAVLMLLETDLYKIMHACASGNLTSAGPIRCFPNSSAATVVLASAGYPGSYPKGAKITGVEEAQISAGVKVFHAGTVLKDGELFTAGGRVMAVSARGPTLRAALDKAYKGVSGIHFEGMQFRRDIGQKGLALSNPLERVTSLLRAHAAQLCSLVVAPADDLEAAQRLKLGLGILGAASLGLAAIWAARRRD